MCSFLIFLKYCLSIITESFISEVEIAKYLFAHQIMLETFISDTSGVETMPAPTIEILQLYHFTNFFIFYVLLSFKICLVFETSSL